MTAKRIKIGIVGVNFGRWIVEDLLRPGDANELFELAAVCDLDAERANAMAAKAGVPAYTDLDELLRRDDIPVIGLFTGPSGRAALLRKLLAAGKDIMTTKPFEVDPDAALAVLQEARAMGRVLHLNSPSPTPSEDIVQIQKWEKEFNLGRPVGCRADVWVSYRETADGSWLDDPLRCPVAPIFRLGIYLINDLIELIGKPERVQVMHSRLFSGRPTPDNSQLAIGFENGALANIYASFCVNDDQYYSNSLTLNYENGTVYRNVGKLAFTGNQARLTLVSRQGEAKATVASVDYGDGSGRYQWRTFRQALDGETLADEIAPEQIADGLRVIAAMARAEKSGATERII